MAPQRNNDRHSGHTGTIPKSKVRNNCNVPQEAVTPTRRDMTSNLVSTSLEWVPVSEYNSRPNYNQSRKPANNSSDQELADLDNTVSFESGYGRFVPVRPQPRVLPLNVHNRENLTSDHHDDVSVASVSYSLHPYAQHPMPNGLIPHSNHAAAAVMIVNPTTPNAVAGNMAQPFNAQGNQQSSSRNNLARNLNPSRNNNCDGNSNTSNTPPMPNSRPATKTVNLMNNMNEQGQGSTNNLNENHHFHRESARALGEAMVAACPDAAAVERRLGQIREYIRVTSSLVDTMRTSEDEAFIEHTKEEYDELVEMVMKLKESESKLEHLLVEKEPENIEVPGLEAEDELTTAEADTISSTVNPPQNGPNSESSSPLKKVTNEENEQLNKTLHHKPLFTDEVPIEKVADQIETIQAEHSDEIEERKEDVKSAEIEIQEIATIPISETDISKEVMNDVLRQNILSCVEKVAFIEELKIKSCLSDEDIQDVVVRPMSVQSNGSAFSENELWPNEIKNKIELSQHRLAALKQQQRRLMKYQAETKQQLEEINRAQSQDIIPSTSHDNLSGFQQRMNTTNQAIGVATTLPHAESPQPAGGDGGAGGGGAGGGGAGGGGEGGGRDAESYSPADEEAGGEGRDSDAEEDAGPLRDRRRQLAQKLRELQLKKQHMENMVTEFQKLQMAARLGSSHNTYCSSGEESADEETTPLTKCSNAGGNMKNEDPFKLMEIKAIKTALQKTKDLMRSVENYEAENLSGIHEDPFQMPNHSNMHDNKSDGGASTSGWSLDGSVCRVRNALPPRHKFTNEQLHRQQQQQQLQQQQLQQQLQQHQQHQLMLQQQQQQHQNHQVQRHEQNIASLQELAQELRRETEKIMGERARLKDMVSNKESTRKQKIVNEEVRRGAGVGGAGAGGAGVGGAGAGGAGVGGAGAGGAGRGPGPAERRQMELRHLLAEKQKELEALLNKEKVLCVGPDGPIQGQVKSDSRDASIANQSYNSEQEEPDSRSEQILIDSHNSREIGNFRGGGDSGHGARSINTLPSHNSRMNSTYASDSDSASRTKCNQRSRGRRRPTQESQMEQSNIHQLNSINQMRHEPRMDVTMSTPNVNTVSPISHAGEGQSNLPFQHAPQSTWGSNKSNQSNDMRTNQFTQNSHSQTMERLLAPHLPYTPPSVPFNMIMPFGVGACGCGCAAWGAWVWQQLLLQQRDVQQLRDQLNHLEERWRAETASHTLNNQVPPGNRANNYWDNFRSYSRQNLLSASSKTNSGAQLCPGAGAGAGAGGPLPAAPAPGAAHCPHPLADRSHNALYHAPPAAAPPPHAPKRNVNSAEEPARLRRNLAYERSLSFSSAPDVLNLNQSNEDANQPSATAHLRHLDDNVPNNVNINRQECSNTYRNVNISNPIPEIIQSHANNINTSTNSLSKKKSSSKLPAKNSANRRNNTLDYCQANNINIASSFESANPNLASTSYETHNKATSKFFDLLRENVYSEVTALIGVNESHPDFLIQLFKDLQLISSDPLRQRVLQSIRGVVSQQGRVAESAPGAAPEEGRAEAVSTTTDEANNSHQNNVTTENPSSTTIRSIDNATTRRNDNTTSRPIENTNIRPMDSAPNRPIDNSMRPIDNESIQPIDHSTVQVMDNDNIRQMDNSIVRFLLLKSEEVFSQELIEMFASLIINNCGSRQQQNLTKNHLMDMLFKYEGSRVCDVSGDILDSLSQVITENEREDFVQSDLMLSESSILQDVAGSLNLYSSNDPQLHEVNCPYELWPGHMHIDGGRLGERGADCKLDLINCSESEMLNGDLAEADQTCPEEAGGGPGAAAGGLGAAEALPDVVDTDETTPTEAEAEWLGLDRIPTRLHMEETPEKQKD